MRQCIVMFAQKMKNDLYFRLVCCNKNWYNSTKKNSLFLQNRDFMLRIDEGIHGIYKVNSTQSANSTVNKKKFKHIYLFCVKSWLES
jgi:hypothetical protein